MPRKRVLVIISVVAAALLVTLGGVWWVRHPTHAPGGIGAWAGSLAVDAGSPLNGSFIRLTQNEAFFGDGPGISSPHDPYLNLPALEEKLRAARTNGMTTNPCTEIEVPATATFELLRRVEFTCRSAGFETRDLRVASTQVVRGFGKYERGDSVTVVIDRSELQLQVRERGFDPIQYSDRNQGGSIAAKPLEAFSAALQEVRLQLPSHRLILQVDDAVLVAHLIQLMDEAAKAFPRLVVSAKGTELKPPSGLTLLGTLDAEEVGKVIEQNHREISDCYLLLQRQVRKRDGKFDRKLDGQFSVRFLVTQSGVVATSQLAGSRPIQAEFQQCVEERVKTWHFPKLRETGTVITTWPPVLPARRPLTEAEVNALRILSGKKEP